MNDRLRPVTAADVPALAALYAETARRLGPACYTPAQVQAWAAFGEDLAAFAPYLLDGCSWVACDERGAPLGFSGLRLDAGAAEVKSLYVRHDLTRQGLGSRLLAHVLAEGRAAGAQRFAAWATPFSRPVFERAGFRLVQVVQGEFQRVMFERYRVALDGEA